VTPARRQSVAASSGLAPEGGPVADAAPELLRIYSLRQAAWLLVRRERDVRALIEHGALSGYRDQLPPRAGEFEPRLSQYRIPGWAIRDYEQRMCEAHAPPSG